MVSGPDVKDVNKTMADANMKLKLELGNMRTDNDKLNKASEIPLKQQGQVDINSFDLRSIDQRSPGCRKEGIGAKIERVQHQVQRGGSRAGKGEYKVISDQVRKVFILPSLSFIRSNRG